MEPCSYVSEKFQSQIPYKLVIVFSVFLICDLGA